MPKRKKLTDADVKKVESVILSDTDVEKADRSKYGVARRSIWYISVSYTHLPHVDHMVDRSQVEVQ